jgi:bis(5'-nucleosidyl)-tetraphosphatase
MDELLEEDRSYVIIPVHSGAAGMRFLVIRHRAGHWGFPKGHAEAGEDAITAARRELEEETGLRDYVLLDAAPICERYRYRRDGRDTAKTVLFFVARAETTDVLPQPEEIRDFAWLAASEAAARLSFDSGRETLAAAIEQLERHGTDRRKNTGLTQTQETTR